MKKSAMLAVGVVLLASELAFFVFFVFTKSYFAAILLSMVGANHLGGRLAFIAVGLENGLPSYLVILIILFYNTTYLFLMYSLFVLFSERMKRFKIFKGPIESLKKKAEKEKKFLKKWNWFGISFFVWIPLPWTGAVIGSYIAHLEGYNTRETLFIVLPPMWIGIISWTLWFDELYDFVERFGKDKTIFLTLFLVMVPILFYLIDFIKKKARNSSSS